MQDWLHDTPQLDIGHPRLRITAHKLTQRLQTLPARAAALQDFVRRMPFSACRQPARTRASEVLARGAGDCHSKAVLFTALCRAAGLPARVQFLRVRSDYLAGIVPGRPEAITHAVAQVHVDGRWVSTDGYVMDPVLFVRAKQLLRDSELDSGWGLVRDASSFWDGKSPCLQQFRWEDVLVSYGVFDDVQEFVQQGLPREAQWLGPLRRALRTCMLNWRLARLRKATVAQEPQWPQ
jgi:transglutaminase-like putative cysteine protease